MSKKTKVFIDSYKGKKIFAVWNVDEHGNKDGRYPVVSLGARKATELINNIDELNKFVQNYGTTEDEAPQPTNVKLPDNINDVF